MKRRPTSKDLQTDIGKAKYLACRRLLLLSLSVACMVLLGNAAMATQWIKDGWLIWWENPGLGVVSLALSSAIGAIVGFVSLPCVRRCLFLKDLRLAVPIVYGISLIIVVVYTYTKETGLWGPLPAALPALLSVCACSIAVRFALVNQLTVVGRCPECGYDLRGNPLADCPECGWRRATERSDDGASTA